MQTVRLQGILFNGGPVNECLGRVLYAKVAITKLDAVQCCNNHSIAVLINLRRKASFFVLGLDYESRHNIRIPRA